MPDPQPHKIQRYGWIPDIPDARDHLYAAPRPVLTALPPKIDLRPKCPHIYDQGELGSCTGNAIAAAVQFGRMKQKLPHADLVPSRLFIYYNERVMEHTVNQDSGAMIRDGIKTTVKQGACFESGSGAWPYAVDKFAAKPKIECYQVAQDHQVLNYSRLVANERQLKGCLASGFPFVFGFSVYDSFESAAVAKSGVVPMPTLASEQMLGGHAVMAVGYDDADQRFIVRNSWGPGWGLKGYFTMPYAYLTDSNLADDFWTVRLIED
jgi:C1A family cysteine protease